VGSYVLVPTRRAGPRAQNPPRGSEWVGDERDPDGRGLRGRDAPWFERCLQTIEEGSMS
jgi:hypothetical protein